MSNPVNSSDVRSADAAIMLIPGKLRGIQVIADGTNAASVILYDSASAASGRVLARVDVDAGLVYQDAHIPDEGILCANGIYADVTGTGAQYIVWYSLGQ